MRTENRALRKFFATIMSFLLVIGCMPVSYVSAASSTNVAKKDGQAETYNPNQYYHVDILVEAEYQYTLTFGKDNVEADHADIEIEKIWNVSEGTDLPDSVSVDVTADGSVVETVTLSEANGWKTTLENLPLYDSSGAKITYEVDEDDVSATGYYETIVTEIESSVTEKSDERLVYTEDGKTITFYFDSTAPHINVNGNAYPYGTANWVNNGDGTYTLVFNYTNPDNGLQYISTWVYDSTKQTYTYISDDYMEVDAINYVTYTNLSDDEVILYDANNYVTSTSTTTRDAKDNNVARDYYNYIEQADTNRADQEFWSTNRAIEDMPDGTTIRVGYAYTYGYYDKFGEWYSYSDSAEQSYNTSSSSFINECGEKTKNDTQRGYDVVLQLTDEDFYKGDGLKMTYDVDITNTPVSSLALAKEVTNVSEMPNKDLAFDFTITLDSFLGSTITDTFAYEKSDGTTGTISFVNGVATVSLKQGETITINGLPKGVGYSIKEAKAENYVIAAEENTSGSVDNSAAKFTNTYENPVTWGDLVISKMVKHSLGDSYTIPADKTFEMTVTLEAADGTKLANKEIEVKIGSAEKQTVTTDENGQITFSLKNGEEATFYALDQGVKATVVEKDYTEVGFTPTYEPANTTTIVADSEVKITVVNDYNPAPVDVKIDIDGTKTVDGNWTDEEFIFYLQKYVYDEDAGKYVWKTIAEDTATVDNPKVDFEANSGDVLTFDAIGTYEYQVIEKNHGKSIDGVIYDATMHTFNVVVTDKDMDGKLEATIESSHSGGAGFTFNEETGTWENSNINFTNEINHDKIGVTIMLTKSVENLSGNSVISPAGYIFELYETDDSYAIADNAKPIKVSDATDQSGESYIHWEYVHDKEGTETHYYKLVEQIPADAVQNEDGTYTLNGVTYDTTAYEIKVVVTKDADGKISREIYVNGSADYQQFEGSGGTLYPWATFTNTYDPEDATITLDVTKKLNGKSLVGGDFTFELYKVLSNNNGNITVETTPVDTAVNDENGAVVFDGIPAFDTVGSYYYKVVEQIPEGATQNADGTYTLNGVTYDISAYYVRIDVTDAGGKLTAKATVLNSTSLVFNNVYDVEPVQIGLSAKKILNDLTAIKDPARELKANEFKFTLTQVDADGRTIIGGISRAAFNDASGNIAFDEFTIEDAGTYYFLAKEASGNLGGIKYDNTVYKFVVVVTDDGDGTLSTETTVYESTDGGKTFTRATEAVFENDYDVVKGVSLPVYGLKSLDGRDMEAGEFTFVLTETDAAGEALEGGVRLEATNDANGEFVFEAINYDTEGDYYYEIAEKIPEGATLNEDGTYTLNGVTYDHTTYQLSVRVRDNGEGVLVAYAVLKTGGTVTNDLTFTNTYEAAPAEISFQADKTLVDADGEVMALKDGQFTFHLAELINGTEHKLIEEKTNDANGDVNFESVVTLDEVKTYTFIVHEVGGGTNEDGIDYDSTRHIYTVEVRDNGQGQLVPYINDEVVESPITSSFENEYNASQASVVLNVAKQLVDYNDQVMDFGGRTFDFELKLVEAPAGSNYIEKVDNVIETITATENGEFAFEKLVFTDNVDEGKYTFEITEVASDAENVGGVTYDPSVYKVTVNVYDNGKSQLEADVSVSGDEGLITGPNNPYNPEKTVISFTNHYNVAPVSAQIEAEKHLFGANVEDYTFTFKLIDEEGNEVDTATNDSDGVVIFDEIEYAQPGTYTYTVREVDDNQSFVTYDKGTEDVSVIVSDNGDGTMSATVDYGEYGAALEFKNVYNAPEIDLVKLQAVNDGEATTEQLKVEDGDVVTYYLTVSNAAEAGTAEDVVITDAIPEGLTLVEGSISDNGTLKDGVITWTIDTLAAGESKTVSFSVAVPDVAEDTTWTNAAAVTFKDNPDDPTPSNEVKVEEGAPAVTIEKLQAVNDGEETKDKQIVDADDVVKYIIKVSNTGTEAAKDVVITDEIPEGLTLVEGSISDHGTVEDGVITWTFDSLDAGATEEVSFEITVPAVSEETTWKNVAAVDYSNDPDDPEDKKDPEPSNEVEIEEGVPSIDLVKTAKVNDGEATTEDQKVEEGDQVTYSMTVTNKGDASAVDVVITDEIPDGLILVADSISDGGVLENGVITWTIEKLEAGAEKTVSFMVTVPDVNEDTTWSNVAVVEASNIPDEPEPSNPVDVEEGTPEVGIGKLQSVNGAEATVEQQKVVAGDIVKYIIKVSSTGTENAKDVVVTDSVPAGLALVDGSISDGGVLGDNNTITWTFEELEGTVEVSFEVEVPAVDVDTVWENIAYVTYDAPDEPSDPENPDDPVIPSEPVEVVEEVDPAVEITKEASKSEVEAGDEVVYTITVKNTGDGKAEKVIVTDEIPEGLTVIEISEGGVDNEGIITWEIGDLAPGEEVAVTVTVEVPAVDVDTTWENIATVTYTDPDTPDTPTDPEPSNPVEIVEVPEEPGEPEEPTVEPEEPTVEPEEPTVEPEEPTVEPEEPAVEPEDPEEEAPYTGDNTNMMLWLMLLATSVAGATGATIYKRRRG